MTNQRTRNLLDNTTDVDKAAMGKLKVERSRFRGESAATSTMIGWFWSSMDNETRERMAKKFSVCFMIFMMAKERPSVVGALLELESGLTRTLNQMRINLL